MGQGMCKHKIYTDSRARASFDRRIPLSVSLRRPSVTQRSPASLSGTAFLSSRPQKVGAELQFKSNKVKSLHGPESQKDCFPR